jgi:hypothetical protein
VRKRGSFCPAPIAPESLVAKATASGCPAGSVSPSLGPRIRLVSYRLPSQPQARLRSRRSDSWEQASKPLPLSAALLRHCHRRLPAEQPNRLPHFLCGPLVLRSPQPAWSVPAPCADDLHTPQCRTLAKAHRSQPGLMSRWTMPSECAASSASAISMASDSTVSTSIGFPAIRCFSVIPSRNSMTMKVCPCWSSIS